MPAMRSRSRLSVDSMLMAAIAPRRSRNWCPSWSRSGWVGAAGCRLPISTFSRGSRAAGPPSGCLPAQQRRWPGPGAARPAAGWCGRCHRGPPAAHSHRASAAVPAHRAARCGAVHTRVQQPELDGIELELVAAAHQQALDQLGHGHRRNQLALDGIKAVQLALVVPAPPPAALRKAVGEARS